MREPDWMRMGYTGRDSYSACCEGCGTEVEMEFGTGEKELLTPKRMHDDFDQEQLYAFVHFWVRLKLERACNCNERFK